MEDYINYITPQFSRTHINFQRVPTVDTSNPFAAKGIPSLDESFVVIHFRNPKGSISPVTGDGARLIHFPHQYISGSGRQNGSGNGVNYAAAGATIDGREENRVTLLLSRIKHYPASLRDSYITRQPLHMSE